MIKILLISEYIAPVQAIASVRWSKIAKYLKKNHKVEISVLTNKKDYDDRTSFFPTYKIDELLKCDVKSFGEYIIFPMGLAVKFFYWIKSSLYKVRGGAEKNKSQVTQRGSIKKEIKIKGFVNDFRNKLFAKDALCYLRRNKRYDCIISSYGPIWTHLIAEKLKEENPSAIWIADFRDPYAKDIGSSLLYKFHQIVTMKHCASADMIFRVNDELQTFTPPNIPLYTITNGFDPEEKLTIKDPQKFELIFTGSLYGNRTNLGVVCNTVCELCQEGKIAEGDIEVVYAGPYGNTAQLLAKEYHSERFLRDYGLLPREKALELQRNAAILLNLDWNTKQERCLWGGKIYEYMMMQKPILCVITGDEPYSNASKNIHHLGGYCYEQCRHEETYPGMKDFILEKYQEWKATGNVTVQQDKEYIEQFAYPHIAEQVWQLIQEGMRKRNESGAIKKN